MSSSKRTTGNRAYNLNGALNRTSVPSLVSAQYRDLSRSRAWVFSERTTNYRTHHTAKTSYTPPTKNTATLSLKRHVDTRGSPPAVEDTTRHTNFRWGFLATDQPPDRTNCLVLLIPRTFLALFVGSGKGSSSCSSKQVAGIISPKHPRTSHLSHLPPFSWFLVYWKKKIYHQILRGGQHPRTAHPLFTQLHQNNEAPDVPQSH
jgi:hypothetical protein